MAWLHLTPTVDITACFRSDFYIPYKYLEGEVLPMARARASSVQVKRWSSSPHVGHLRANREEYRRQIETFLITCGLVKQS